MNLPAICNQLDNLPLDGVVKGQPFSEVSCIAAPAAAGHSIFAGGLPLPQAILKASALDHNSRWMRDFVARHGARIAPHVKTHMAPHLIRRQIADGAWGVTVATVQQFEVCRRIGARRIILANQLIGQAEIAHIVHCLRCDPGLEFYCSIDSPALIARLRQEVQKTQIRLPLLVELGYWGGRTGCRSIEEAVALGRLIMAEPGLKLAGVQGFEGLIAGADDDEKHAKVDRFLADMRAVHRQLQQAGGFARQPALLTAGGSLYYDRVLTAFAGCGADIVTRSGCYISHDSGGYARRHAQLCREQGIEPGEGLRPALEIWAYVQSRPEAELAILTFGKRDCGFDAGYPVPLLRQTGSACPEPLDGAEIVALSDQHAHMRVPESLALQPGDKVGCGIKHPCTTFDKWAVLHLVDDDYRVKAAIRTFF